MPNILADIIGCKKKKITTTTKHHCPSTVDLMSGAVGSSTRLTETMDSPLFSDVGVSDRAHGWVMTKKHRPHINYRDATLQEVRKHLQSGESDHRQVLIWSWKRQLQIETLGSCWVWEPLKNRAAASLFGGSEGSEVDLTRQSFSLTKKNRPIISSNGIRWQGKDKIIQAFLLFSPPEMKSGGLMEL